MDGEQVLALRYARSGLDRRGGDLPPASDFARDAGLIALAARAEGVTREGYLKAIESGDLVVAHSLRCAIHVHAAGDEAVFGRPLIGQDERELKAQLGPWAAGLAEVTEVVRDALEGGPLSKDELHEALRGRVRAELLPWCPSCKSHHVPGGLWRYAAVAVGTRLDAQRRYRLSAAPDPPPGEAARRFQRFYPGAGPVEFGEWAGLTPAHARRLWVEPEPPRGSPPEPKGVRLLPPGDPFLQKPNRALLAPDPELRKRLFRPAGSPGVVLLDGRVAGLWRSRGGKVETEPLERLPKAALDDEIERLLAAVDRG